jgi:hypothetical protein
MVARSHFALWLAAALVVALAGCGTGAAGGKPVNFRVSLTFDYISSYDLPVKGSSTLDGTFGLDYLRQQPVETSAKDDATWKTASDQAVASYEEEDCGLGSGECTPCTAQYTAPRHDVAVVSRIDSRSGDTAVAYVWTYNAPDPGDIKYHSGCNAGQHISDPWHGWGPILITATLGPSDVLGLAVAPEGNGADPCCSLTIERLP